MTEEDRKQLYWSLLRGIVKDCQDKLCAADTQHDWGPVEATDHWPDIPFTPGSRAAQADLKITRSFRRECCNCGKVERLR